MKYCLNFNLLNYNTFGIEAKCKSFIQYTDLEDAKKTASILTAPFFILGGGSNLLLTKDYHGTVVKAESRLDIKVIKADADKVWLRCWAGTTFDDVVEYAVNQGYYGLENLSLIPGEVGASAVQNIGAYGVEIKDVIDRVEAINISTGLEVSFTNADCQYSYRQSRFKNEWHHKYLITYVVYCLSTKFNPRLDYGNIRSSLDAQGIDVPTAKQLRDTIISIRQAKLPDPKVLGNAGSFFMNPIISKEQLGHLIELHPQMPHYPIDELHVKIPAGWLIEQSGWKGRALGRAAVHDKQALVLVNRGGATGADVLALCNTVREAVLEKFDIQIKPEVNIL
ncbi:UDP-N-acetylmuramate dehydrogenase [Prevotella sp. S7 MS 2]|uniref:UDP-N-acetylmuramate dehydrogenase n=1 Tax=Prevotella sp. S7 MS 2 TaxID=1287488 RepID=UPI000513A5E3|nr:UDP-N-acetylmuramate dehydrogenase [Prevotella sp. S7 MS 2]KGI59663.1 UDP-N-acetylenolpyruvoylglucosamine reductase [Prevotella sp. S7 MS 2]